MNEEELGNDSRLLKDLGESPKYDLEDAKRDLETLRVEFMGWNHNAIHAVSHSDARRMVRNLTVLLESLHKWGEYYARQTEALKTDNERLREERDDIRDALNDWKREYAEHDTYKVKAESLAKELAKHPDGRHGDWTAEDWLNNITPEIADRKPK